MFHHTFLPAVTGGIVSRSWFGHRLRLCIFYKSN